MSQRTLTREEIRLLAEGGPFALSDEAVARVEISTGGQPEVVRWLYGCLAEYARWRGKDVIQDSDVVLVLERAVEGDNAGLSQVWETLDGAERLLLVMLAQQEGNGTVRAEALQVGGPDLTQAADRLVQKGFLRRGDAGSPYAFVAEALRRWILVSFPAQDIKGMLEKVSFRAGREYELARERHLQGDLAEAIEGYRRAVAINPNHGGAWLGLAQALSERGEAAEAVEAFERAYQLDRAQSRDGLVAALLKYGRLLHNRADDEGTVRAYQRVLAIAPDDRTARQNLSVVLMRRAEEYLARGDADRAQEVFRQVLDLDPGDREVQARLAEVSDRQQVTATLAGAPPAGWGGREWRTFVVLGVGLCVVGLFFFALSRRSGPSLTTSVSRPVIMPSPTATAVATVTPTTVLMAEPSSTPTPRPTDTMQPTQTSTPTGTATRTPTPKPTRTPTRRPPTDTPTPTDTVTPVPTPTVTPMPPPVFNAPQLLGPPQGEYFSGAQTRIELRWTSVGLLDDDEWYGLSVRYRHGGQDVETGAWLKETLWVVTNYLAGQADEPERKYQWDVVVVKEAGRDANGNRIGQEVSPRSETRKFVWR